MTKSLTRRFNTALLTLRRFYISIPRHKISQSCFYFTFLSSLCDSRQNFKHFHAVRLNFLQNTSKHPIYHWSSEIFRQVYESYTNFRSSWRRWIKVMTDVYRTSFSDDKLREINNAGMNIRPNFRALKWIKWVGKGQVGLRHWSGLLRLSITYRSIFVTYLFTRVNEWQTWHWDKRFFGYRWRFRRTEICFWNNKN